MLKWLAEKVVQPFLASKEEKKIKIGKYVFPSGFHFGKISLAGPLRLCL